MLRASEISLKSLPTPFKALAPMSSLPYDMEDSEERSSNDEFDYQGHSLKIAHAGSRSLGLTLSASRGASRNASVTCASWVPAFLSATYFQPCERHRHHKKNECTFFCVTCGAKPHSVCQHCMGAHAGHQVIQVRRYVYCDVVRTCDINAYVDTTGVQNYIINSAKVMFLNHRPHSKIGRANGVDTCRTCHRHLREGYSYCSLACKVEALTHGESGLRPCPGGSGDVDVDGDEASAAAAAAAVLAGGSPRRFDSGVATKCAVRSAAAAAAHGGVSSDPESSEPGEDTFLYGTSTSRHVVRSGSVVVQQHRPTAAAAAAAAGGEGHGSDGFGGGAGSSEDDCCDFNFENPPKRRRSALTTRRPASLDAAHPGRPNPRSAAAVAAASAASVAAAAATLLQSYRNGIAAAAAAAAGKATADVPAGGGSTDAGGCSSSDGSGSSGCESAAAAAAAAACMSRRKQNAPQRSAI
ncbi:hypothetical protein Agub_g7921 [Astrephomene gubernaculifera]|uniref:PLATZ transcription factor-domain-containing protein n=1 Tax=Astrephomene gubernaculifera TaxID=47775 RepID=A0AAD3DQT2_9CHLO|nr:hypothetical protein Agub_g7921 [Astrephomene gubernaculifera]